MTPKPPPPSSYKPCNLVFELCLSFSLLCECSMNSHSCLWLSHSILCSVLPGQFLSVPEKHWLTFWDITQTLPAMWSVPQISQWTSLLLSTFIFIMVFFWKHWLRWLLAAAYEFLLSCLYMSLILNTWTYSNICLWMNNPNRPIPNYTFSKVIFPLEVVKLLVRFTGFQIMKIIRACSNSCDKS